MLISIFHLWNSLGLFWVMTATGCPVCQHIYQTLELPSVSEARSLTTVLTSLTVLAVKYLIYFFTGF